MCGSLCWQIDLFINMTPYFACIIVANSVCFEHMCMYTYVYMYVQAHTFMHVQVLVCSLDLDLICQWKAKTLIKYMFKL